MKKRIISLILACMTMLTLVACGGGTKPNGNDKWWTTTGTLNKQGDEVVFDNVELKLTTVVAGEDKGAFSQIVAEFNALYRGKISIDVRNEGQDNYENIVSTQITNNSNAPDLIMSHQKSHKSFADNKMIQPFNEAMEESGIRINLDDYATGLAQLSSLGHGDNIFSIPVDAQSMVVYYNKPLLEKYGGELPKNRDELIALASRVAAGEDIIPIAWDTSLEFYLNYVFTTAVIQNGGTLYNNENYRADWHDNATNLKAYKDAIESIRGIIKHNPSLAAYGVSDSAALNDFLSNKALFYFGMPWNINSIIQAYGQSNGNLSNSVVMSDYVGGTSISKWFAMNPEHENSSKIFGDSHFFAISKTVTDINKKAAICEFVKWFTQKGSVGATWADAGHISASNIILQDQAYKDSPIVSEYINNFYPDINDFVCIGNTPYFADLQSRLSALFISAMSNTDSRNDESLIKTEQNNFNSIIDFINM